MKRRYLPTVFIEFFVIRVRRLFEGGAYLKSNLFLENNSMVTDHFKKKKIETRYSACRIMM